MVKAKRGFSLVELLVVIGIIALLIGILIPATIAVRQSAMSVQCQSNLRNMTLAVMNYAASSQGYMPPATGEVTSANAIYVLSWDYTTVTTLSPFSIKVAPGTIWIGTTISAIHQCPSFYGRAMASNTPYSGYNYNTSYVGRGSYAAGALFDRPVQLIDFRHPASTALFGDGEYASVANKYMRSPGLSGYPSDVGIPRVTGTQGFRHRGKTNVAFVDGHVESRGDRHTAGMGVAAGTGFLSDDNSMYDLR